MPPQPTPLTRLQVYAKTRAMGMEAQRQPQAFPSPELAQETPALLGVGPASPDSHKQISGCPALPKQWLGNWAAALG